MLFIYVDGGTYITGYTQIIAFDKNGEEKYNLNDHLFGISESINRNTVKITDNVITFSTVASDGFSKGSDYAINFSNGIFEEPKLAG